jgi:hypothetical protein
MFLTNSLGHPIFIPTLYVHIGGGGGVIIIIIILPISQWSQCREHHQMDFASSGTLFQGTLKTRVPHLFSLCIL